MIRQSTPLQTTMVTYSCVGVSRVTIRSQAAQIAEWQGSGVRIHLISPWRAHLRDHADIASTTTATRQPNICSFSCRASSGPCTRNQPHVPDGAHLHREAELVLRLHHPQSLRLGRHDQMASPRANRGDSRSVTTSRPVGSLLGRLLGEVEIGGRTERPPRAVVEAGPADDQSHECLAVLAGPGVELDDGFRLRAAPVPLLQDLSLGG